MYSIVILFYIVKLDDSSRLFSLVRAFHRMLVEFMDFVIQPIDILLSTGAITKSGSTFGQLRIISPIINWSHLSGQFQKIHGERDAVSLIYFLDTLIDKRILIEKYCGKADTYYRYK